MPEEATALQIDPKDLREKIIPIFEEVLDQKFNEETVAKLVDQNPKLVEALKTVNKGAVIIGELPDEIMREGKVTLSQFLGDVRRRAMNPQADPANCLRFLKPDQLITADSNIPMDRIPVEIRKDLYEGLNTAGGYLVPTEESRELLNVATELYSVVPGLCRRVPMRTHQITFPTRTSGLTAYWIPEATATLGKTPTGEYQTYGEKLRSDLILGQMTLTAFVCAVKVVVSNQLLDDSDPQIETILRGLFSETLADAWDDACLDGAGTALDPITGLNTLITTNALAAGAVFNFDDIIDLVFGVIDNDSRANPVIIGTTKAEKVLMKVKDADGQYLYKGPREVADVPSVWGHGYYRDGNISNVLGAGTNETRLYSGDFRRHGFAGERMGLIIKTNPWAEPFFSFNQTAFLAEFRVGFTVDAEKYFSKMDGVPTV